MRVLLPTLFFVASALSSPVVWFGIGQNTDLSMEIGFSYGNWGANIYNAGNYDYAKKDVIDSRPPHTLYVVERDKVVGGIFGLDVMYFIKLWKLRPFIEGGFTITEKRNLAISTNILDRGAIYTLSRRNKLGFAGGVGTIFIHGLLLIGIEYHTEKGIVGQFGFAF